MICSWCKKPVLAGETYAIVGNQNVHLECLKQWQKDDPLEWEGMQVDA